METLFKSETELRGKLEEEINIYREERRDWKRVEGALRGQVKELKKKTAGMESDRGKLEEQIRIYRGEMCELMRVEEALRGQVKELKKKIGGMEIDREKIEELKHLKELQDEGHLETMKEVCEIFWFTFKLRCFVLFVSPLYDFISSFF